MSAAVTGRVSFSRRFLLQSLRDEFHSLEMFFSCEFRLFWFGGAVGVAFFFVPWEGEDSSRFDLFLGVRHEGEGSEHSSLFPCGLFAVSAAAVFFIYPLTQGVDRCAHLPRAGCKPSYVGFDWAFTPLSSIWSAPSCLGRLFRVP